MCFAINSTTFSSRAAIPRIPFLHQNANVGTVLVLTFIQLSTGPFNTNQKLLANAALSSAVLLGCGSVCGRHDEAVTRPFGCKFFKYTSSSSEVQNAPTRVGPQAILVLRPRWCFMSSVRSTFTTRSWALIRVSERTAALPHCRSTWVIVCAPPTQPPKGTLAMQRTLTSSLNQG